METEERWEEDADARAATNFRPHSYYTGEKHCRLRFFVDSPNSNRGSQIATSGGSAENIDSRPGAIHRNAKLGKDYTQVEADPRKIYVSNINFKTGQKALWTFLERFGRVKYCGVLRDARERSKGCALVTFDDEIGSERALQAEEADLVLHNRTLRIENATRKKLKNQEALPSNTQSRAARGLVRDAQTSDVTESNQASGCSQDSALLHLPDDCLLLILANLTPLQWLRTETVCVRWRELCGRSWQQLRRLSCTEFPSRFMGLCDRGLLQLLRRTRRALRSLDLSAPLCRALSYHSLEQLGVQCPNLVELNLSGSQVSNRGLRTLSQSTPNLKKAVLDNCLNFGDKGLWWLLHQCPALEGVSVAENRALSGRGLTRAPPGMLRLCFNNCVKLEDTGVATLAGRCARLESLSLSGCVLLTSTALVSLTQGCTGLRELDLSHSHIQDLEQLSRLVQLEQLQLRDSKAVSDQLLHQLSLHCTELRWLDVSRTGVSDAGFSCLASLPRLTHLDISYTQHVTGAFLSSVATQGALQSLVARGCLQLTSPGVEATLSSCEDLTLLDLSGCRQISAHLLTHVTHVTSQRGSSAEPLTLCLGGTSIESAPPGLAPGVRVELHDFCNYHLMPRDLDVLFSESDDEEEEEFDELFPDDEDLDFDPVDMHERFNPS